MVLSQTDISFIQHKSKPEFILQRGKHLLTTNYYVLIRSSMFQINRLVLGQIPLHIVCGIVTNNEFYCNIETSRYQF